MPDDDSVLDHWIEPLRSSSYEKHRDVTLLISEAAEITYDKQYQGQTLIRSKAAENQLFEASNSF